MLNRDYVHESVSLDWISLFLSLLPLSFAGCAHHKDCCDVVVIVEKFAASGLHIHQSFALGLFCFPCQIFIRLSIEKKPGSCWTSLALYNHLVIHQRAYLIPLYSSSQYPLSIPKIVITTYAILCYYNNAVFRSFYGFDPYHKFRHFNFSFARQFKFTMCSKMRKRAE